MKRFFVVILALALVAFLLVGCGGKKGDDKIDVVVGGDGGSDSSASSGSSMDDVNFGAIMAGGAGIYTNLSPGDKQALIDAGKAQGIDVTFLPDGSVRFEDKTNGTVIIQHPDGTWTIEDEDGTKAQIGGNWPDNEFTKLIPKPDFELAVASEAEDNFSVVFAAVTVDQVKNYVGKVQAAGFTVGAETEEMEAQGMEMYNFTASNAAGYSINIYSIGGSAGLTIEKP